MSTPPRDASSARAPHTPQRENVRAESDAGKGGDGRDTPSAAGSSWPTGTARGAPQLHNIRVARTARYATLGAEPANTQRLWMVFHGYGQLALEFLQSFTDVVPSDTRVVAPEGLSRFYGQMPRADGSHLTRVGATWLTREARDDDLRDVLAMLHAVYARVLGEVVAARGTPPRVGVLGFSQGVAMAVRWTAHLSLDPPVAIAATPPVRHVWWAGNLPHDVNVDALRTPLAGAQCDVVIGSRDAFLTDDARRTLLEACEALGVTPLVHEFTGGHRLDTSTLGEILATL